MNDSDKTITGTLSDDQKGNAITESDGRSNNGFDALAPVDMSSDPSYRSKYGRLSVSNYDDPRWYEQPDNKFTSESGDRFIPTSPANLPASMHQQTPLSEPAPDTKQRFRRIFGQAIITLTLMILAFLGGWFGHQ